MKKLFLRDGKLMIGEFPDTFDKVCQETHDPDCPVRIRAEAAKASAVEVVAFKASDIFFEEGKLYDIREGWTVEYFLKGSKIANTHAEFEESHQPSSIKKFARLINISGIAATGVPEPIFKNELEKLKI